MTVLYNSKNHWGVITGKVGTMYPDTIVPSIVATSIYVVLWGIDHYSTELVGSADSTLDDIEGSSTDGLISAYGSFVYTILNMLLVVTYFNTALQRYFYAAQALARFNFLCQEYVSLCVAFTSLDDSEGAIEWRTKMSEVTIEFIRCANDSIIEPGEAIQYTMNNKPYDGVLYTDGPYERLGKVSALIHDQNKYLKTPLLIPAEMKLHQKVTDLSMCLTSVYSIINTQFPFMLANCTRVLACFWVLAIPFSQSSYLLAYVPLLWLDISARVGLILVSAEITDPFGQKHVNNLDVHLYLDVSFQIFQYFS